MKKSTTMADALKAAIPTVVPKVAQIIVGFIPKNSRLEDFLSSYKDYWEKVVPFTSMLVMQATNAPEFVDEIVSELSAEVARAIKEKYKDGVINNNGMNVSDGIPLGVSMTGLDSKSFINLVTLINSLPEEKRKTVMNFQINKDWSLFFAKTLSDLQESQFKSWVELNFPDKKPNEETTFEKSTKAAWNEFQDDSKTFFQKDSWVVRLAKKNNLM